MNSRSVAIFAVVVAIIVGTALWFLNSSDAPHYTPKPAETAATPAPSKPPTDTTTTAPAEKPPVVKTAPPTPEVKPETPPTVITKDDQMIDQVLRASGSDNSDASNTATAQNLINLLPTLTKDGQVECAQHIANLISDKEFGRVMHFWKNPGTNPDVIEVLATDLMNRDDSVKLPAMLDAAKMPNHPYHDEALVNLEIFLDGDYGTDWNKWESVMKDYLKKQAEETQAEENAAAAPPAPAAPAPKGKPAPR